MTVVTVITAGSVEANSAAEIGRHDFFHKRSWELKQDDVDQIWAETLVYYNNNESLILPSDLNEDAVKTQRESMETDDREPLVREYLEKLLPENWYNLEPMVTSVRLECLGRSKEPIHRGKSKDTPSLLFLRCFH